MTYKPNQFIECCIHCIHVNILLPILLACSHSTWSEFLSCWHHIADVSLGGCIIRRFSTVCNQLNSWGADVIFHWTSNRKKHLIKSWLMLKLGSRITWLNTVHVIKAWISNFFCPTKHIYKHNKATYFLLVPSMTYTCAFINKEKRTYNFW